MLLSLALASILAAAPGDAPGGPKLTPPVLVIPAAEPPKPAEVRAPKVAPWVVLGLSVAAGVAGGVFAKRSADAITMPLAVEGLAGGSQALIDPNAAMEEVRAQQTAVLTNGIAASVLLGAASAGLVGSLIALFSD